MGMLILANLIVSDTVEKNPLVYAGVQKKLDLD